MVLDDIENLLGFSVIFGILLSDELSLNGVPKEELEKEISKNEKYKRVVSVVGKESETNSQWPKIS